MKFIKLIVTGVLFTPLTFYGAAHPTPEINPSTEAEIKPASNFNSETTNLMWKLIDMPGGLITHPERQKERAEKVSKILATGYADVNARAESGYSPLGFAIQVERDPFLVNVLLRYGADKLKPIHEMNPDLPLHAAVFESYTMVNALLSLDVSRQINALNIRGNTPLLNATSADRCQMMEALLDHGADIDFKNEKGTTALIGSIRRRSHTLEGTGAIMLLLHRKANTSILDNEGQNALAVAQATGDKEIVQILTDLKSKE